MKKTLALALALLLALSLLPALPAAAQSAEDYPLIYSTFNTRGVQNGPTYYTNYRSDSGDVLLQAVTTYHYNYGLGATPGWIGVYEWDTDLCLGQFPATGRFNNTYWDAFPNITLREGVDYYFTVSDPNTWSYNVESEGEGACSALKLEKMALGEADAKGRRSVKGTGE